MLMQIAFSFLYNAPSPKGDGVLCVASRRGPKGRFLRACPFLASRPWFFVVVPLFYVKLVAVGGRWWPQAARAPGSSVLK